MGKAKGDEHASRINYLFQAASVVSKMAPGLNQYYGNILTVLTEKTAPKKDFTMKRSMCKKCKGVIVIGQNATYRLRKNRHRKGAPNIVIGCLVCGEQKRIGTKKGYQLKAETHCEILGGARLTPTDSDGNVSNTEEICDESSVPLSTEASEGFEDATDLPEKTEGNNEVIDKGLQAYS